MTKQENEKIVKHTLLCFYDIINKIKYTETYIRKFEAKAEHSLTGFSGNTPTYKVDFLKISIESEKTPIEGIIENTEFYIEQLNKIVRLIQRDEILILDISHRESKFTFKYKFKTEKYNPKRWHLKRNDSKSVGRTYINYK